MWIPIVLIVLVILLVMVGVMVTRGGMPPTDYKQLFIMGIIFTGAGVPLMVTTRLPALFIVGLALMAAGLVNRGKWEENAEANKWENLTEEQRATRRMVLLILLALGILGLVAFGAFALVAN